MEKKKNPLMLYVTSAAKKIVDKIDAEQFLGLQNTETSRTELFIFAMALGLEIDTATNLDNKESLTRASYLVKEESLLYSAFINSLEDKSNLDECVDKKTVFELAERYANTGFGLIEAMMETKSEQINMLEMIEELDEKYKEYFN